MAVDVFVIVLNPSSSLESKARLRESGCSLERCLDLVPSKPKERKNTFEGDCGTYFENLNVQINTI